MKLLALALPLLMLAPGGMKTYKSKEATIRSSGTAANTKAVGKRIDYYCQLFEEFYSGLGLKKRRNNRLKLRLYGSYDDYEGFYQRTGSSLGGTPLAYFSPSLNSVVMYSDERDVALRAVVFHESSHQFLNRYTSDAPKWLNEGLAEYFEGWKVDPGKSYSVQPHLYDLFLVQTALKDEKFLAPRKLIGMQSKSFNSFAKDHKDKLHGYLHYATSWSLVYYGLTTTNQEDHERLVQYIRDLRELGPNAKYTVDDWGGYTDRWRAFVLALDPKPTDALDHFLVASGHRTNGDYDEAAKGYQRALKEDPKLPGTRYWMGYCLKRQGNYKEAYAALEQVLIDDPDDARAPYYLARMRLGIDKESETPNPEQAYELAKLASDLVKGSSPYYLEVMAKCQLAMNNRKGASATMRKILKAVEKEDREFWEQRLDVLKKGN